MTLKVFTTDLLIARAMNSLLEVNEWLAELEAPEVELSYHDVLEQQILFASQALAAVLQELAARGCLRFHRSRGAQLELELGPAEAIADPGDRSFLLIALVATRQFNDDLPF